MSRIALILPTLDQLGGAERQVLLLAEHLARRNHQITILVLTGTLSMHTAHLHEAGVAFDSLHMRKAWIDPRGWLRYLHWHRQFKPQVVHTHLPHAVWFARWVRLLAPVPVLLDTCHTTASGSVLHRLANRLSRWAPDRITAVSAAAAQRLLADRAIAPNRLAILHNGIAIPNAPLPKLRQPAVFHWVATGRLVPLKDYPSLLSAFATLPPNCRLTIAGTGPEETSLRALAESLSIAPRVHFAGFVSNISSLLAAADAFVLASLWEGLPLGPIEAAAHSLPVVATDGPGTRETLLPGQSGFLVPTANPSELATAMLKVMQMSPEARFAMGAVGHALALKNFDIHHICDRLETLYADLLAASPRPARFARRTNPRSRNNPA